MSKSEITIWPQKTFKESIAIYDEWNFERNSLARTQNEFHNDVQEIVNRILADFNNTRPDQKIRFDYQSENNSFRYFIEEYYDGHLFINFYVSDHTGTPALIASCFNNTINFNEDAITAFINMKQALYEFEQWPIKGFYETFIRSTKVYLEMD